ncbi:MAG: hypothetical protein AUH13_18820 [Acidobacteria bacterium 13_2_20CM_58_27]|nr:MAG: hypothetical protein AUH13_18820 [Acidobacteria bacterium 13_2_20CM_58_27]
MERERDQHEFGQQMQQHIAALDVGEFMRDHGYKHLAAWGEEKSCWNKDEGMPHTTGKWTPRRR